MIYSWNKRNWFRDENVSEIVCFTMMNLITTQLYMIVVDFDLMMNQMLSGLDLKVAPMDLQGWPPLRILWGLVAMDSDECNGICRNTPLNPIH